MFIHSELVILILALAHTGEFLRRHEAVPHGRPYMVLLERHMQDGKTKYCSGFVLNEDFVMTAAHCQARSYTVLLGVHNVHNSNEIQHVSVHQVFPHKDYDATVFKNDIMILKGDSGGPLVCEDGKAYGVVSCIYTPKSGGPQISAYAKIPDYSSNSTMKKALKRSNTCII